MDTERNNVVDLSTKRRIVDHELCRDCPHDDTCTHVCLAIETLVQLCKVRSPMSQLEYIYNVGTRLDLDNSFTAQDL